VSRRYYSSNAADTTLSGTITAGATSITVGSITGHPVQFPYTLILDPETASEEVVSVTAGTGTNLTVSRGQDGTTALSHTAGAVVRHGVSARDFDEPNAHVNASSGVHGLTGSVVGTSDTQTLTGKTISVDNNTVSGIAASSFVLSNASGNVDGSAAQKAVPTGTVVGTTDTQTLTNKTLALGSNTVSGTLAQLNTAVTDADIAQEAGGTFTPQASTSGTWTTSSATGYWRRAGNIIEVWGILVRSSGGLTSGAQLTVYASGGPPAFSSSLSSQVVGEFTMAGYGSGILTAGAALADGFAARGSDGNAFQPTFSGAAQVSFHLSYPV
jgi:hypothetical protein